MTFEERCINLRKAFEDYKEFLDEEALGHFSALPAQQRDWFSKQIYEDTLVPGVGNKRAHQDFLSRPRTGVHVILDLNDFKAINDLFSYDHGDKAIAAVGQAFSQASRAQRGKLFRVGGDEFHHFAETPEQAYAFLRDASKRFKDLVPVGGTHKLSFSAGVGLSPAEANEAIHHAKTAKTTKFGSFRTGNATIGHGQNFVHSSLPGAAGPVATEPAPSPS